MMGKLKRVPFTEATAKLRDAAVEQFELSEQAVAPGTQDTVDALLRVASPRERELLDAFLTRGSETLADAERLCGWAHGYAAVLKSRLLRKLGRAA